MDVPAALADSETPRITTVDPVKDPRPTPADILSADDFFEECSPTFAPVAVEGIAVKGQPVYVARLTAGGLDSYFKEIDGIPDEESRGAILAFAIVRANGSRVFAASHRAHLSQFPADKSLQITGAFFDANGLGGRKK